MVEGDRDRALVDVYRHADAWLRAGEAALPGPPVALGEVGVVDVGLVNPDGAAQHDPVPVAGYRGEHAVLPLEGCLVGDAAQPGRALDGDDGAHESNESDPDREHLSAVLEDGAREGGEPPAAAARLVDGFSVQQELIGGEARHEHPEGVCLSHMDLPHPPERPPEGLSPNKDPGGRSGKFSVWLGRA